MGQKPVSVASVAAFSNTKSVAFGGTDEYMRVTDDATLDITDNLTIACWVKAATSGSAGGGIVCKEDYGLNKRSYALCQDFNTPSKMAAIVSPDGTNQKYYTSSITAFTDGTVWSHIAMTFSDNSLKLYVNGVLDATPTKVVDDTCHSLYSSNIDVALGCMFNSGAVALPYTGKCDEPCIFNATLSAAEITELFNGGIAYNLLTHSKAANLVSWWRMGDGAADSITSIKDQVGSNHATPTNMESGDIVLDVPRGFWLTVNFDGGYMRAVDHASLHITNNLTVSAWVKAASTPASSGIVAKHDFSSSPKKKSFLLAHDFLSSSKLAAIVSEDGDNEKYLQSSLTAFDNTWHHVAMTFSSNTLKMYVDGVLDPAPVTITPNTVNTLFVSSIDLVIGGLLGNGSISNVYTGKIDEPSIWNAALTAGEISEIYNSGHPANLSTHSKAANLVSWWRMGDGATDTIASIKDQVNSNHMTPSLMVAGNIVLDSP